LDRDNQLVLTGVLIERDALRHTPAGIPVLDFRIAHASTQIEAAVPRQVELELACVAVQERAKLLAGAPLGAALRLSGFLAPKSRSSKQLVLHVQSIEFKEGADHGHDI